MHTKKSARRSICWKHTESHNKTASSSPWSANRAARGTDFWDLTRLVDQGLLPSDRGRTLIASREKIYEAVAFCCCCCCVCVYVYLSAAAGLSLLCTELGPHVRPFFLIPFLTSSNSSGLKRELRPHVRLLSSWVTVHKRSTKQSKLVFFLVRMPWVICGGCKWAPDYGYTQVYSPFIR